MRRVTMAAIIVLATGGCASIQAARVDLSRSNISQLHQAIELFRMDTGRYPSEEEGVASLLKSGPGSAPYVASLPSDPWGNPYRYRLLESGPVIESAGPDGKFGTGDDVRSAR